jgi:hypothetical protein
MINIIPSSKRDGRLLHHNVLFGKKQNKIIFFKIKNEMFYFTFFLILVKVKSI